MFIKSPCYNKNFVRIGNFIGLKKGVYRKLGFRKGFMGMAENPLLNIKVNFKRADVYDAFLLNLLKILVQALGVY